MALNQINLVIQKIWPEDKETPTEKIQTNKEGCNDFLQVLIEQYIAQEYFRDLLKL